MLRRAVGQTIGWIGQLVLTATALAGLATVVVTVVCVVTDARPVIVRSGSMSPAISTGSLAWVHRVPADRLAVGDIVTVPTGTTYVTHRIVGLDDASGPAATLTLRGDANSAPDPAPYVVDSAGRFLFAIPRLGAVVVTASTAPGIFVTAGAVALLIGVAWRGAGGGSPGGRGEAGTGRKSTSGARRRRQVGVGESPALRSRALRLELGRRPVAAAILAAVLVVTSPGVAAWAAWGDSGTVSGSTLRAGTVAAPVLSCGTLRVGSADFTWTSVPGATSYTFFVDGVAQTTTAGTTATYSGLISGGTATVRANRNFGSVTWSSTSSNSRSFTVLLFLVSLCS